MSAYVRHIAALERYVSDRTHPGGWLYLLLSNDLRGIYSFPFPDENTDLLPALLRYAEHKLPDACWGSPDKVRAWLKPEEDEDEIFGVGA